MKIYNTLTKKVEPFVSIEPNKVKMYTCGPTVYNYAHIGNLRTYISEDVLQKTLEFIGYDVERCMNITDVGHLTSDGDTGDDKMKLASERENKTVLEIADYYTQTFLKDIEKLNIKKPAIISKATDNIDEYIKIITKLLENDKAYLAGGNIYFDTSKLNDYYVLTNHKTDDLLIGARESVLIDNNKKNQADFVLWFTKSKFTDQEQKWESPWGLGYPGWHIECSAISMKYLGEYLDIHCGAVDNIFPHHTNEIAQCEAYLNHKWCNYWVHMEFLNDITGKMSKSKGEFLTLESLISKGYNPLAYRLFCLQSHYRKQLEFSFEALDNTAKAYQKLLNKIKSLKKEEENLDQKIVSDYIQKFKNALEDDLNTSYALTVLYDLLKENTNDFTKLYLIKQFDQVLSLDLLKEKNTEINSELKDYIEQKIKERNIAKQDKNYELADQIRNELLEKNIIIKDTRQGTIYEIKGE